MEITEEIAYEISYKGFSGDIPERRADECRGITPLRNLSKYDL